MDKLLAYELQSATITDWRELENVNRVPGLEACRVAVWKGDICRLKVGAIVNAANSQMLVCLFPFPLSFFPYPSPLRLLSSFPLLLLSIFFFPFGRVEG
jgi:hypothetical protein